MRFVRLQRFVKRPYLLALIVAIILIKLPPFYIVPGIEKSNSFNLARLCILFSFFAILFMNKKNQNIFGRVNPIFLFLLIGYLFTQSISIIYATNTTAFLNVYKDLVLGLLLLFTMLLITKEDVIVLVKVFLVSALVGILYQSVFIFFPSIIGIVRPFLNFTYMQFVEYQSNRGRYFGDTLDEALIPILFYYLVTTKKLVIKIIIIIILVFVIFLVILSSWRTKFIILIYAILGTFFLFKQLRRYFFIFFVGLGIIFVVSNSVSLKLVGQNIYDRLLLSDEPTETLIEKSRLLYLKDAYEIGLSNPIIGSGLGNYYDNLLAVSKRANQSPSMNGTGKKFILIDDPHNILFSVFATTGTIGLISITALLLYFFFTDIPLLFNESGEKIFVVTFWGYFIFSFFNPWMYFSFLIPFWFFRGAIENIKLNK